MPAWWQDALTLPELRKAAMNAARFASVLARVRERVLRLVGVFFVSLCIVSTFNQPYARRCGAPLVMVNP